MQLISQSVHHVLVLNMNELKYSSLLVMQILAVIDGSKILGYFPIPSYSHSQLQNKLMIELYNRGHEITLVTALPPVELRNKIRIIDISAVFEKWETSTDMMAWERTTPIEMIFSWKKAVNAMCEGQINLPDFQEFIRSGETFDMLIMEQNICATSALIFMCHNPVVVEVVPYEPFSIHLQVAGNAFPLSHAAMNMLPYSDHMTFFQRLVNCYAYLLMEWYYNFVCITMESSFQERLSKVQHPVEHPKLSLLITHDHWSVTYPAGILPNVLEVRGLLIDQHEQTPSEEILKFMDDATEGLIYLSMGTNLNSSIIPEDKIYAFLETFMSLPYHVIWKWDIDPLPDLPRNIMQIRWAPQQAVLAHPKTKLFITQGGMQSLQQTIYYEVPLIVIPFLPEQKFNGRKVQDAGIGEVLGLRNLTKDTLLDTITRILNNYKWYEDNLAWTSSIFRDDPMPPLEKTIWWLEYCLRHKGSPHLESATLYLNWIKYLMLDVLAIVVITTAVLWFIIIKIFSLRRNLCLLQNGK